MNRLTRQNLDDIAKIHLETLSKGLLSHLGYRFLIKFYQYINSSELEKIFVIKHDDQILAACIVSFQPDTLFERVLKKLFIHFICALAINILANKKLFMSTLRILFNGTNFVSQAPEITYIFTNPKFQNNGLGKKLLSEVENSLRVKNIKMYYVKTINCKENNAIIFYINNGFRKYKSFIYDCNLYLYLRKRLDE